MLKHLVIALCLAVRVHGSTNDGDPKTLRSLLVIPKLRECAVDCNVDTDCKKGLLCAAAHKKELIAAGYDPRKAYCGKVGTSTQEVCYNPTLVIPKPKIKECEANCFRDSDCEEYLLCGRTNKDYLNNFYEFYTQYSECYDDSLDEMLKSVNANNAYCGDVTKDNEFVCFDQDYFLGFHY